MPKKSKAPKVPKQPEDYFVPNLFKEWKPPVVDLFPDVVGIPSTFFSETKPGIKKKGRPKKITVADPVVNNNFGFQEQEFTVDIGDSGTSIKELAELLPDMVESIFEEYMLDGTDKAKIEIFVDDGFDPTRFESDWMTIDEVADVLTDEITDDNKWYNMVWDSQKQALVAVSGKWIKGIITVVKNPYAGNGQLKVQSKKDFKNKKSVVLIENDDELCLGRCLVIALADRDNHPKKKQIKMGRKIQTELVHELYEKYNMPKTTSSLNSIMEWENHLDCSITIIDSDNFNNITYPVIDSSYVPKDFNIYVLKDGDHFHYVNSKSVAGFFCKDYFCNKCKKTYKCKDKHKCEFKCNICCCSDCPGVSKIKEENNWIKCPDCWRSFPNETCYDNHLKTETITKGKNKGKSKKSVCESIFKCPDCKVMYDKSKFSMAEHKCGDCWCKNCDCKINSKEGHRCFMMPKKIKEATDKYIYFDFECSQDTGRHTMNYGIAEYHDDPEPKEFMNIDEFMEWLLTEDHKGYSVLAHNGRGYDFQLIMEYIYKHTIYKPVVVYAGSKIMILSIKELNLRFVDSLNFLTMPLASFPKTFGIKELKKGFFPHYYNTTENFYYKGKIPPMRYFGYNSMPTDKREEFIKWWTGKRLTNYYWDQFAEMKSYCISDVDILRRSCIIFKDLFQSVCDIDPFQYTTIASVCMAIFKGKFLCPGADLEDKEAKQEIRNRVFQEQKIGIIPFEEQEFIRKSFFGGRTNSIKLKYKFKNDEIGVYSDITSLYPTVNYFDEYPIGHPIELTENFGKVQDYFGFIDCYVVPPKGLYFPLLATKGDKLTFDLEPKRGVWTTIEINKAVELGYKITKIYKVLHYKKRSNSIFKGYVSQFLKIKQEASGKPAWCKTESDLDKYIKDYHKKQGILLDRDKIQYNPGLRAIAKLCLNSLWGKFGQRLNMPKNEIISDSNKFTKIMFNDEYTGQAWSMIDDHRMEMTYKIKDEYIQDDYNTNIAIASFTTSHARLRLYWALERLNRQVLYHDTDSVVYVYDKNNPDHFRITNGDLLGDWTDELDGVDMCGTFLGAGPKNYSYETTDGELHTKIKGFTLNHQSTRRGKLTHQSMEDMIDARENKEHKIPVQYSMIIRDKKTKIMTTRPIQKNYGFVYDKREIQDPDEYGNIDTLPFGY